MGSNLGTTLASGKTMNPGDYLQSANGNYRLTMQTGGDLTLGPSTQTSTPPPWIWHSGTGGNALATCQMATSGDLIIYDSNGVQLKHSGTAGNSGAYLVLDNTGVISILTAGGSQLTPPWQNGSMS